MKLSKSFLSVAVILLAAAGAYATASTTSVDPIFYYDSTQNCVAGTVNQACEELGTANCSEVVLEISQTKLIYSDISTTADPVTGKFACQLPYHRP